MLVAMKLLALWLFVINLGIVFGAGFYEHRIVLSRWVVTSADGVTHWNPAAARADDTGRRFWVFVSTIPLTLLALANLIVAAQASGPLRVWWLAASGLALVDRLLTFGYFIPRMIGLMQAVDSPQSVDIAQQWLNVNYIRHALVLAAWLASLRTFGLMHARSPI